ncbi:MAG: tetratricopeptide repeat protein [Moraxellaceae bacterium]|nr:tetratricopeptide repeat protein [Moraxellaceae bacterium]
MLPPLVKNLALVLALASAGAHAQDVLPDFDSPPPANLPAQELSGAVLFEAVLAELAALRRDLPTATAIYLDLARKTRDPRYSRRATELALVARDFKSAGDGARLWLAQEPGNVDAARVLAGVVASSRGKIEELESALVRVLAGDSAKRGALMLELPSVYAGFTDKAAALASIERLTAPYLNTPEAQFARAGAYADAKRLDSAEAAASEALKLKPDFEQAAILRAQSAPAVRRAAAMEQLGEFGKQYPQAREARMAYGRWLVSERRNQEAAEVYRKLLADFPDNREFAFAVALLSAEVGDNATAEAQLRRLISEGYRPDLLHLQLGRLLASTNRDDAAVIELSQVGVGENYAAARMGLAQIEVKRGRMDAARALLRAAAEQDTGNFENYLLAEAQLLRQNQRDADSLTVLNELLARRPDNQDALYESALTADRLQKYDVMESRLRRLIVLRPDGAHAYNALGYSFADRNVRLDEAEKLIAQALKLQPEDAAILDSMGWVKYRRGDLKAALDYLQRAHALNQDAEITAHLGEVLWALGRRDEARKTWQGSLKDNPESTVLRTTMLRLTGEKP